MDSLLTVWDCEPDRTRADAVLLYSLAPVAYFAGRVEGFIWTAVDSVVGDAQFELRNPPAAVPLTE